MSSLSRFVLAAAALLTVCGPASAGILELLVPKRDLQTVTVTDFTAEGRLLRTPSPQKPLTFIAISGGYRDLGAPAMGEKKIPREVVHKTIYHVLAQQGYVPAKEGQKPDVLLTFRWGTMNVDRMQIHGQEQASTGATVQSTADAVGGPPADPNAASLPMAPLWTGTLRSTVNDRRLLDFMGGGKVAGLDSPMYAASPKLDLAPGLIPRSSDAQSLLELSQDDLYVAVVCAYAPELRNGRPVMLWNTRISSPARGYWLPDALPTMLAMAGPLIGRETATPVIVHATDKYKPSINMPDIKVLEYEEPKR